MALSMDLPRVFESDDNLTFPIARDWIGHENAQLWLGC